MPQELKIVAISDTHDRHNKVSVPDGDILIHAGDLTSRGELSAVKRFNKFIATLPHRYKIVIAGNHDFCFERNRQEAEALLTNCTYLHDSFVVVEGIKIYGSPWQPWFFDWAFNLQRGPQIREKWDMIPSDTDILVTHGPPLNHGDMIFNGQKVGCEDLLNRVHEIKPKYHIFGHIHEAYGITQNEHTTFINASTCDLSYKPTNPPVEFKWELAT